MEINEIKINNESVKIGDRIRILKFTDDSGQASDLYGVESHLNAWVEILYVEPFEGVVTYDDRKMMFVIKGDRRSIPLSSDIRYDIWNDLFDRLSSDDKKSIIEDYELPSDDYDSIINYLVKL